MEVISKIYIVHEFSMMGDVLDDRNVNITS